MPCSELLQTGTCQLIVFLQAKAVDSVSEVDDTEDFHGKESGESEGEDSNGTSKPTRQFTWKDMEKRLLHYVKSVRHLLLQMSYVPAIVCMMVSQFCNVILHGLVVSFPNSTILLCFFSVFCSFGLCCTHPGQHYYCCFGHVLFGLFPSILQRTHFFIPHRVLLCMQSAFCYFNTCSA